MTGNLLGIIIMLLSATGIALFYWADHDRRKHD